MRRSKRRYDVNGMRARAVERTIEADHATGGGFGNGEIVLARDSVQSLRKRSGLRRVVKRDVNIIRGESAGTAALRGLQLRTDGDFGFVPVDFPRSGDNFAGDRPQFGFCKFVFAAASEKQKNESGACRENANSAARMQN